MQSRRNATIGVNPIVAKNNTIVTLHVDDEERGSERLAPYGELHGDDTPGFHQVAPNAVKCQVGLHELIVLPSKLLEDGVRHHVDEHPGNRLPIDVTLNIQWLQVLARLFGLLKHDLFRAETHLSDLLLVTSELGRQREYHVDVHTGLWQRSVLDQRRLIIVQQVHVIVGGRGCRGVTLFLHPPLLLHRDHWPDVIEVLISLLLDRFFPHLLRPYPLDPPPLAKREA
jgi:hypothetical protein